MQRAQGEGGRRRRGAEPDGRSRGAGVDLGHLADLGGALGGVALVDAEGVDPEVLRVRVGGGGGGRGGEVVQGGGEVGGDGEGAVVQEDGGGRVVGVAPDVGDGGVGGGVGGEVGVGEGAAEWGVVVGVFGQGLQDDEADFICGAEGLVVEGGAVIRFCGVHDGVVSSV